MKKRVILLAVAAGLIVAGYFLNRQGGEPAPDPYASANPLDWPPVPVNLPPPPQVTFRLPDAAVPEIAPPPVAPRQEVALPLEIPIQDGATIDFSIGAPVIRSGGRDAEELDRALKEMADATKDMVIPPPAPGDSGK